LIDAGWSIEKETEGLELKDKFENKRFIPYVKNYDLFLPISQRLLESADANIPVA
jgi:hypothetical protein